MDIIHILIPKTIHVTGTIGDLFCSRHHKLYMYFYFNFANNFVFFHTFLEICKLIRPRLITWHFCLFVATLYFKITITAHNVFHAYIGKLCIYNINCGVKWQNVWSHALQLPNDLTNFSWPLIFATCKTIYSQCAELYMAIMICRGLASTWEILIAIGPYLTMIGFRKKSFPTLHIAYPMRITAGV